MKNVLGYDFSPLQDGRRWNWILPSAEIAQDYNRKIAELVWEVAQLLKS